MTDREKSDLNLRALGALGWKIERSRLYNVWTSPEGERYYYRSELGIGGFDIIGNPYGLGGCWGQVMVANRLTVRPDGDYWHVHNRYGIPTIAVLDDSPGEAVARWCIEARKAGLKLKWRNDD
jgi:hypothetical protein